MEARAVPLRGQSLTENGGQSVRAHVDLWAEYARGRSLWDGHCQYTVGRVTELGLTHRLVSAVQVAGGNKAEKDLTKSGPETVSRSVCAILQVFVLC